LGLKKHVAKRYLPSSIKWKFALKGIGKLYSAISDELEKGESSSKKALADAAYRVGLDFGKDFRDEFHLGSTIADIVFAMQIEHKIFGMKASIAEKNDRKVVFHCWQCAWQKYFTPKLCNAIGQAEKGIAQALNPEAKYNILQTRTMGKTPCIFKVEI
jgi:hypothetical protein